ncbi:molybdopterin biosynthesis protein MoeB [Alishewanella longhuensis]|uniref:Molybdopterin biosynthesis protein MoeB n=1 Tax=Alishewanella longhuensis TaxID=1091037 RepID=A0ABQ3KZI9_9ALTE|nr:HesA/MoeB/ThiF family protein [Alishewanella longhuensis]GHG71480.1 molybdopterin biosynthesis protein MoeB [Alishewanella longhuensis]
MLDLTPAQQLRYSAQLLLPEVTEAQQRQLLKAKVLIVGLGGLGTVVASYLAGAGVGHLLLADDDRVSVSNLPRQLLYSSAEVGQLKVDCAKARLQAQNPDIVITSLARRLSLPDLLALLPEVNLVLDCTDNTSSRLAINQACYLRQVPLISGAASGWQGQLLALKPWQGQGCYQCLYPDWQDSPSCLNSGILGPMVGAIACQQALMALKLLLQIGDMPFGRLHCFDGLHGQSSQLQLQQDPACPVCTLNSGLAASNQ